MTPTPLFPPDLQCHRAQMPAAVLCQGLAVRGTFPNLLAEFAPAQTTFSKALWPFPNLFGTSSEKKGIKLYLHLVFMFFSNIIFMEFLL